MPTASGSFSLAGPDQQGWLRRSASSLVDVCQLDDTGQPPQCNLRQTRQSFTAFFAFVALVNAPQTSMDVVEWTNAFDMYSVEQEAERVMLRSAARPVMSSFPYVLCPRV